MRVHQCTCNTFAKFDLFHIKQNRSFPHRVNYEEQNTSCNLNAINSIKEKQEALIVLCNSANKLNPYALSNWIWIFKVNYDSYINTSSSLRFFLLKLKCASLTPYWKVREEVPSALRFLHFLRDQTLQTMSIILKNFLFIFKPM